MPLGDAYGISGDGSELTEAEVAAVFAEAELDLLWHVGEGARTSVIRRSYRTPDAAQAAVTLLEIVNIIQSEPSPIHAVERIRSAICPGWIYPTVAAPASFSTSSSLAPLAPLCTPSTSASSGSSLPVAPVQVVFPDHMPTGSPQCSFPDQKPASFP
jgi:hypothetical protein